MKLHNSKGRNYNYIAVLIYRLLIALLFLLLSRFFLYLFNLQYFSHLTISELLWILLSGLRFDISTLFILNMPFIIALTLPLPFLKFSYRRFIASTLYLIGNIWGLSANFIDIVYFRFTQKRMTGDIFDYAVNDLYLSTLLPQFLTDYLFYLILFIVFVFLFVYFSFRKKFKPVRRSFSPVFQYSLQTLIFLIAMASVVIGIRGGFQLKPINIITAGMYAESLNVPMVLNTPFTIIKTFDGRVLQYKSFFDENELSEIFTPLHQPSFTDTDSIFQQKKPIKNIVVVIMESLSSEHIGAFNRQKDDYISFTPFLDSLIDHHAIAFNGYAGSKQSIEGIPAIVASLPGMIDRPYINSAYAANRFNSLASLLGAVGFHTAFYHGGTNGTMNFDGFASIAGFEKYYGRTEYNKDADFDGTWGIFDEPFFEFFAQQLNQSSEPFFATFFSLSAHHPYTIPPEHEGKFRDGYLPIQKSIMYADFSLKQFFEKASKMPWYSRTLFVVTADHTSEAYLPEYKTRSGMYKIPILFFTANSNPDFRKHIAASQTDIMPTILAILKYPHPYIAFGQNLFSDTKTNFAVNYLNGTYQIISGNFALEFDGNTALSLYDIQNDELMNNNLINILPEKKEELERILKAYIQQFNNRMINNKLTSTR
jgi:phosphoglycerol transferase MdoB-like AlkP superfamily enzyme